MDNSSALSGATALGAIVGVLLVVWFWVIVIKFLRTLTKAARRFLDTTPAPLVVPPPPRTGPIAGQGRADDRGLIPPTWHR